MTEVDDVRLLESARRGEEQAFSQLYGRYQRAIYRYAAYMCGREAGDDVVQETFLVVLRQTGRHDAPGGTVAAYLFGIARHVVMKRLSARDAAWFATPVEDVNDTTALDEPTALEDLTRSEMIAAVRTAVQSLPGPYREAVLLCELQEMNYATAAGVMQCPIGTVRSRLSRARALLATKLASIQREAGQNKV